MKPRNPNRPIVWWSWKINMKRKNYKEWKMKQSCKSPKQRKVAARIWILWSTNIVRYNPPKASLKREDIRRILMLTFVPWTLMIWMNCHKTHRILQTAKRKLAKGLRSTLMSSKCRELRALRRKRRARSWVLNSMMLSWPLTWRSTPLVIPAWLRRTWHNENSNNSCTVELTRWRYRYRHTKSRRRRTSKRISRSSKPWWTK